jgi:hypothetical protein
VASPDPQRWLPSSKRTQTRRIASSSLLRTVAFAAVAAAQHRQGAEHDEDQSGQFHSVTSAAESILAHGQAMSK